MDFTLTEDSQKYERGFRELLSERGYDCKSGIRVQLKESTEREITISYEKEQAVITASETAFLYRGLMSLVMQLEAHGTEKPYAKREEIWLDRSQRLHGRQFQKLCHERVSGEGMAENAGLCRNECDDAVHGGHV